MPDSQRSGDVCRVELKSVEWGREDRKDMIRFCDQVCMCFICVCVDVCIYSIANYGAIRPCHPVCVCVCVCVFIKLHITAQSGLVILVILCHSH